MKDKEWICTDIDTNQWGRKIKDKVYEFKQDDKYPDGFIDVKHHMIYLDDYSENEILENISPYGYTVDSLKESYSEEDVNWLIAECIFEQI